MEIQNTLENKEKFFAQYWGQEIALFRGQFYNKVGNHNEDDVLRLKHFSSITDEDAKKIGFRCSEHFKSDANESGWKDELRYLGYAVEWNGVTVEKQIEYGWIKLIK